MKLYLKFDQLYNSIHMHINKIKQIVQNRLLLNYWIINYYIIFQQEQKMINLHQQKLILQKLQTDIQLNYQGPFNIIKDKEENSSIKFILKNKNRNWLENQLYRFAAFLHYHPDKIEDSRVRKQFKIFKNMSQYVRSRNSNQCRNYYLKMIKKFGNLQQIQAFFKDVLCNYDKFIATQRMTFQTTISLKNKQEKNEIRSEEMPDVQLGKQEIKFDIDVQCVKELQLKITDTQYQPILPSHYGEFIQGRKSIEYNKIMFEDTIREKEMRQSLNANCDPNRNDNKMMKTEDRPRVISKWVLNYIKQNNWEYAPF